MPKPAPTQPSLSLSKDDQNKFTELKRVFKEYNNSR